MALAYLMGRMLSTMRSSLPSAEICRRRKWGPGTILEGEWMPKEEAAAGAPKRRIQITAVGHEEVLAMQIAPEREGEALWDLHCREWKEVR